MARLDPCAFSLVILTDEGVDRRPRPWGFRPLCLGGGDVPADKPASAPPGDDASFDLVGAELGREIGPGEARVD